MCVGMMLGERLCNLWDGCVGGYGVFVCGMRGRGVCGEDSVAL